MPTTIPDHAGCRRRLPLKRLTRRLKDAGTLACLVTGISAVFAAILFSVAWATVLPITGLLYVMGVI